MLFKLVICAPSRLVLLDQKNVSLAQLRRGFQALWVSRGERRDAREGPLRHWSRRQLSAAWASWRGSAAQLRLVSGCLARARSRELVAALVSWVASARALSHRQQVQRSARAYLHAESRACKRVLVQWLSATLFGQQVGRCSELWSRRGARRTLASWLSYVERLQLLRAAAVSWSQKDALCVV